MVTSCPSFENNFKEKPYELFTSVTSFCHMRKRHPRFSFNHRDAGSGPGNVEAESAEAARRGHPLLPALTVGAELYKLIREEGRLIPRALQGMRGKAPRARKRTQKLLGSRDDSSPSLQTSSLGSHLPAFPESLEPRLIRGARRCSQRFQVPSEG